MVLVLLKTTLLGWEIKILEGGEILLTVRVYINIRGACDMFPDFFHMGI